MLLDSLIHDDISRGFISRSAGSWSEPSRRGHGDGRGPVTGYHWTYGVIAHSIISMNHLKKKLTPCMIVRAGEDANILPLFFPCGSIKREVLPTALRENGERSLLLCLVIKTRGGESPSGSVLIIKGRDLFVFFQECLCRRWLSIKPLNIRIWRKTSATIL